MADNIFTQTSDAIGKLTEKDVARLAKKRNPDSNADEVRIAILAVLLIATGFCLYTGFLFYQETFARSFGSATAFVFALALAAVVEISKVLLGTRVLRAVFFGWAFKDLWNTGFWIFAGALFIGAFYWSVSISTDGMQLLTNARQVERDTSAEMTEAIAASTASIDAQIKDAQATQKEALANKWKGQTTWAAQQTATQQGKQIAELQKQRAAVIDKAIDNWQSDKQSRSQRADLFSDWVRKYGGFAEAAGALALLALAMNDRRVVSDNLKMEQQEQPAPQQQFVAPPGPQQIAPMRGVGFNEAPQRTYFNRGPNGNVVSAVTTNSAPPGK